MHKKKKTARKQRQRNRKSTDQNRSILPPESSSGLSTAPMPTRGRTSVGAPYIGLRIAGLLLQGTPGTSN